MIKRIRRWWALRQNLRWFRRTYGVNPGEWLAGRRRERRGVCLGHPTGKGGKGERPVSENSRYPVFCNDCGSVQEGVFRESGANSSPVWLRCGKCYLFSVIAPFHRYGLMNGSGALFQNLYFTIEEAKVEVATWDSKFRARGFAVIEWVEKGGRGKGVRVEAGASEPK